VFQQSVLFPVVAVSAASADDAMFLVE